MSLGDGLARALRRYIHAKSEFGLRALLMGEADIYAAGKRRHNESSTNGNGHGRNPAGNGNCEPAASATGKVPAALLATKRLDARDIQWQQAQYKVLCPDCQSLLRFSEGCMTCEGCGYSKC